jgi:DNA-directed RNA polymerase specialized sigma24 family protein
VPAPQQLPLDALAQRCAAENARFQAGAPHETRFAHELLRRALAERDNAAWEYVYELFAPMVERWVRRCSAFERSDEGADYFVAAAFTRFWRAIGPERFSGFATLGALLLYLRRCAECVVIDSVRAHSHTDLLPDDSLADECDPEGGPDELALDRIERAEFWRYVLNQLHGEAERVVICRSFLLGMRPGDIFSHRQDLFASINDVYSIRRNVIKRLGRDEQLRSLMA